MQKKLIALAIAGLASSAAFAQTNVTVYGIVDAGYMYSSGEGTTGRSTDFSGIQSGLLSGSRLGFRGAEDLGGGLSAIFTLEYALTNDVNSGPGNTGGLNARQTFVGFKSNSWGQVSFGRQYGGGFLATATNAATAAVFDIQSILSVNAGMFITPNSAARINNSINWVSPNWSGFSVNAIYGFGENTAEGTDTGDNRVFSIRGNYANGPLNLDAVWGQINDVSTATVSGSKDQTEWYLGGKYDFGMLKLFGTYQDVEYVNNDDAQVWTIGVTVPAFKVGAFHVTYGDQSYDRKGVKSTDADAWNLTYTHDLSKRTTLYAGYTDISNEKNGFKNRVGSMSTDLAGGTGVAQDNNSWFAGVRHSF